jgi:hypothetical protein
MLFLENIYITSKDEIKLGDGYLKLYVMGMFPKHASVMI